MKHAVVLLSGGLDSATTLAIARDLGYETYALSFDYGQRHRRELEAAAKVAKLLGAKEHRVVKIDSSIFSGSALTDDVDVPKARSE
ncbi:MAG TPA: 7-cyano-7-deazaguanine synthase, partial [Chthoniobacterales bacterium]|nr:7-cyano-7-deazaguanine synthase [Chthoniobacterales bacterium]